jgi:hypothetical protein
MKKWRVELSTPSLAALSRFLLARFFATVEFFFLSLLSFPLFDAPLTSTFRSSFRFILPVARSRHAFLGAGAAGRHGGDCQALNELVDDVIGVVDVERRSAGIAPVGQVKQSTRDSEVLLPLLASSLSPNWRILMLSRP